MKFEFSPHVAQQEKDYGNAKEFYEKVLGMEVVKTSAQGNSFQNAVS